ncbi:hypothetical protein I4F81_007707 [Pyropia yezoensis]|uniref:Uncharacterized protein n=1 Tax=Pyropia yezoensis TaxID=2788 RepID=A0ACC3C4T2_PYRYE|nr:hypothetical protein I4F81_007707 [Neopyropia yezoensis]
MVANVTRVPSTPLTREEANARLDGNDVGDSQVEAIATLTFQQSINCCGVTSVAYALSALGCPTTVDDLFLKVGMNVDSAVGDGMTLAEIYDAAQRYVARVGLPIFVECYHFDEFKASAMGWATATAAELESGLDDLLILNFHSGIAHGWASGGGGHFSVLAAADEAKGDVIMADVHGVKYGSFWATPATQMFEAMADKDSCGRSRGALRFGRTDRPVDRPLPGLTPTVLDWAHPPAPYHASALRAYVPHHWDAGLGARNMARSLAAKGLTPTTATVVTVPAVTSAELVAALVKAGLGKKGVVVLAAYEFNTAYGAPLMAKEKGEAGALSHGTRAWSPVAAVDADADTTDGAGVVLAPAHHVILAGRLWATSAERLAAAMAAATDDDGNDVSFVVLDNRGEGQTSA